MKSYQFFTEDGRGGTMLCDDETLADAVAELTRRFEGVIKVQIGKEVWEAPRAGCDNVGPAPSDAPPDGP
ncbi:hypothetical protein [Motiliproteus sp. SC1-56]|uniref:hypothetical protein n=1 Tax=Motiliproteus sp. SC1-56 TaxID=2799565 RepID=UPI001A90875B|nr:hypothetical protein [Motiliproteus sp. SC1-56]